MRNILCSAFGHKVNRRRVWHDKLEFRTACDRCDAALIRGRHGWREYDVARDDDPMRQDHPAVGREEETA